MKLKYDFIIDEVAGQKVAIPLGQAEGFTGGFLKLNNTGAYIMELLKNDITEQEIISEIQKNYEVDDVNEVKEWVTSFIESLKKADVLL